MPSGFAKDEALYRRENCTRSSWPIWRVQWMSTWHRSVDAPTESWFSSFKNERFHGVRYAAHAEMKAARFEYIEFSCNPKRRHSTLGYRSLKSVPRLLDQ